MKERASENPTIRICFGETAGASGDFHYQVSQALIRSDREVAELAPFAVSPALTTPGSGASVPFSAEEARELPVVYEGRGWIGGSEFDVVARAAGALHRLEVEDGTVLSLGEVDGECLLSVAGSDLLTSRLALLGPGLALALALSGRFSLHAGGVEFDGRSLALMGESGSGKSTLSALATAREGCRRIADDVVPVRVSRSGELELLPRFPQLKLNSGEQWDGESELACRDILCLRRDSRASSARFTELSARDCVLRLLESTVGSRLFSPELRERQLDSWVRTAGGSRAFEWRIPEGFDRLDEAFDSLAELPKQAEQAE